MRLRQEGSPQNQTAVSKAMASLQFRAFSAHTCCAGSREQVLKSWPPESQSHVGKPRVYLHGLIQFLHISRALKDMARLVQKKNNSENNTSYLVQSSENQLFCVCDDDD